MPVQMNDNAARFRASDDPVTDHAIKPIAADEFRSMLDAVRRAGGLVCKHAPWQAKQMRGARADVSWDRSTGGYAAPCRALLSGDNGR